MIEKHKTWHNKGVVNAFINEHIISLNKQGQPSALFWCDGMMREDYKIYGDAVIFDITYRTIRYNLICGPIVGINNHWNTVMFGCAL